MPDRLGTYNLKLHYVNPGWTFVDVYDKIFSRPWNYKEYTKDTFRDLPSLAGVLVVMGSFAILAIVFLYDNSRLDLI